MIANTEVSTTLADDFHKRWNIIVEFLPWTLVNLISSYLDRSPLPASNRLPEWLNDKVIAFPLNIWVEGESSMKEQPSLVMTIGASGSGKTTWATSRYRNVYSSHDYFTEEKVQFDFIHLPKAHNWCKAKVLQKLIEGDTVCVSNCNDDLKAMCPYVAAVVFGELPHKIVFVRMPFSDSKTLCKRSKHGVSEEKIVKTMKKIKLMGRPSISTVLKAGPYTPRRSGCSKVVMFLAVYLNEDSISRLRDLVNKHSQDGLHEVLKDCHLTIQFKPTKEEVDLAAIGDKVEMKVKNIFSNDWIQCVSVSVYDNYRVRVANKHFHITVAHRDGISPVLSNYVIEHSPGSTKIADKFGLQGRIGALIRRPFHDELEKSHSDGTCIPGISLQGKFGWTAWSHEAVHELRRQLQIKPTLATRRMSQDCAQVIGLEGTVRGCNDE